jgi:protein-S-isoprenylcysteine O-methyltransferase Ste14
MASDRTNPVESKSRFFALIGSAIFLFVAPGTLAGLVPWWLGNWRVHSPFLGFTALRVTGGVLMAVAFAFLVEAFLRFALQGIGTPAPIYPTKRLVVSGSYRFVRNPMYVSVVSLILGQSLFFGDIRLFVYGLFCWLAMHLFVLIYEEPTLRRTFPADYAAFTANVPRWIPRLTPWHGSGA